MFIESYMFNGANYGQQDGVKVVHFQASPNGWTTRSTTMDESHFFEDPPGITWLSLGFLGFPASTN